MTPLGRVGDIEVAQDLDFERRAYRVRKVAAVLFALILLGGLIGVLGRSGPLSDASVADGAALGVDYERFLRLDSPTDLVVRLGAGGGPTEIAISRAYLEGFRVAGFSAEPQGTAVEGDRVVYTFEQDPPSELTLVLQPQEVGYQGAELSGPAGSDLSFEQWVWP